MEIKILCSLWGLDHLPLSESLQKIKRAGFDGVDCWLYLEKQRDTELRRLLEELELLFVAHQWQAQGATIQEFNKSYRDQLNYVSDFEPLFINSHTGHDYFTFEDNCTLIETASEVSANRKISICHEIHRGRFTYAPMVTQDYLRQFPEMVLTADFSHWCCVTESYLENFQEVMDEAIRRSGHVHARLGHPQSAQVFHPNAAEWDPALHQFLAWWDRIVDSHLSRGARVVTFTTEFGPPPYMAVDPQTGDPIADHWEVNKIMKNILQKRYCDDRPARESASEIS